MVVILGGRSLKTPILVGMEMYGNVWYFSGISPENSCLCSVGWCHAVMSGLVSSDLNELLIRGYLGSKELTSNFPKTSGFLLPSGWWRVVM